MKLQFPLSVGVLLAAFGSVGCAVSDAEIPSRAYSGGAGNGGLTDANDNSVAGQPAETSAGAGSVAASGAQGGSAASTPVTSAGGAGGVGNGNGAGLPQGGAGGSSSASGGAGGASVPASGSGGNGNGSAGSGGTAATDTCPTAYTVATHIVMNVSWDSTLALASGSGQVHVWTKSHFVESGDSASLDSQSCGSVLPTITTSAVAGGEKVLPEIPDATWDSPNMPHFLGTATRSGDTVTVDPGVALVGLTMSNPTATWPSVAGIMAMDHDGDGKGGITAVAKTDSGYSAPPADFFKTARADKLYLAIRNVMKLSATVPGCPESYTGTANVSKFENHVIGCHIKGGGECNSTQSQFEDDNRTVYKLGAATFTSQRIDANATCAQVRAALPR